MSNSLAKVHPELVSEWAERNFPLMLKSQTNRTFDVFRAFEYDKGTKEAD